MAKAKKPKKGESAGTKADFTKAFASVAKGVPARAGSRGKIAKGKAAKDATH